MNARALGLALALAACNDPPMARAAKLEAAGQHRDAAFLYRTIAKADPANLGAWDRAVELYCTTLADVGECLGVLDLELELLGKLDRHHDALATALESRARARIQGGLLDAAAADLSRAIQAAPERASTYAALAVLSLAKGERAAAAAAMEEAAKRAPNLPELKSLAPRVRGSTRAEDAPFGGR